MNTSLLLVFSVGQLAGRWGYARPPTLVAKHFGIEKQNNIFVIDLAATANSKSGCIMKEFGIKEIKIIPELKSLI